MGESEHSYERILVSQLDADIMKDLKRKDAGSWAKHTSVKVSHANESKFSATTSNKPLKKTNSFLGFDIEESNVVADDETEYFPAPSNVAEPLKRVKAVKKPVKEQLPMHELKRRPSSLPEAPNFVEHLDTLLQNGRVNLNIVDDGKPKMWAKK